MFQLTKNAKLVWNVLNGVFMVYKPSGIHVMQLKDTILKNLCKDLNELDVRPPYKYVSIDGPTNSNMQIRVRDSYADNTLVAGPRYVPEEFKFINANFMCTEVSGVLVCGINSGTKLAHKLKTSQITKFYKVKGIFGQARDNDFITGRIIEKSTWKKIRRHNIDRICAAIQASHQKKMFDLCGVDIRSQEAYDLAVEGLLRPATTKVPMIYTVKCIDYTPPEFTLEIVCINETDEYLKSLTREIGIRLHSTAYCNYLQCSQFGLFNVKDALLSRYWNLQCLLDNVSLCHKILKDHPYMLKPQSHLVNTTVAQETEFQKDNICI